MLEIIGIEEIMADYKLKRAQATNYLNTKGCPVLPRKKHEPYRVVRHKFEEWMENQKVK
ncbi:hypothetical protein [Aminipila sp.]|uniref:hypothetical protein n=1 Tax=Aminipila sp. TaxID=2060095 RepID=UPI00289BDCEC|nr:hypothetical protein [Aminipila sp.]